MSYKWFASIILAIQLLYLTTRPTNAANTTLFMPVGENFVKDAAKISQRLKPGKCVPSSDGISGSSQRHARSLKNYKKPRCSGNKMQFDFDENFTCKYDDLCYQVFRDCCSDFVKQCGNQTSAIDAGIQSRWKCIELPRETGIHSTLRGLWMITECAADWPDDKVREKCKSASSYVFVTAPILDDDLPVISKLERFTYRNKYCAICNHEKTFTPYEIEGRADVTPPENFELAQKLAYILSVGGSVFLKISNNQPKRYCVRFYTDKCENVLHPLSEACSRGPVEIFRKYYKNKYCAKCNKDIDIDPGGSGGPGGSGTTELPPAFNMIFTPVIEEANSHKTYVEKTPECYGYEYDKDLQMCQDGTISTTKESFSNKFLILITYRVLSYYDNYDVCPASLIKEFFGLESKQISGFSLRNQRINRYGTVDIYYKVASFYLTLTPFQQILLANHNNISAYVESKKFLKLFNFSEIFPIFPFTILKIQTKQLGCYQGKKLQHNEFTMDNNSSILYEKGTTKSYSLRDYFVLNDTSYIVLCSKLVLSDCPNGTYVKLFPKEFVILPDLSLYHNRSNMTYQFGGYQITESLNERSPYTFNFPSNISAQRNSEGNIYYICERNTQSPNSGKKENVEISICIPTQRKRMIVIIHTDQSPQNSLVLQLLTLIGFSLSSAFLLCVLITYGLFSELRTLPGLNLMSLCLSMLLSNIIWLMGVPYFHGKLICVILAVLRHYLLLVTFHAMLVISFHSSLVFSQSFVVPRRDKRMKSFFKYSLFVWLQPAIFITICLILDKLMIFTMDYGVACWLGTKNAILYMFLLPVALLFVFNIASFIRMAANLLKHDNGTELLMKKGRQNLKVCVKLATLVSFPWVFSFLCLIFPRLQVFQHLFVVFTCFQGFYIAVAFLCTRKILVMYRKRFTVVAET